MLQRTAELVRLSFIAETRQSRTRGDVMNKVAERRCTTHCNDGDTLCLQVPPKSYRQGLKSRPVTITLNQNHCAHLNENTGRTYQAHRCSLRRRE